MKVTTCLQYCINGMGQRLFDFTKSKEAMKYIEVFKKMMFNRDNQIKELLIVYNSYYMVQAAIKIQGLPETPQTVIRFMSSNNFDCLHKDIINTVEENYSMLMNCLSSKDKRKLHALFD